VTWPTAPERAGPATIVVREGIDTFIRSWNDQLPQHKLNDDSGADETGPIGSFYSLTGLRYLVMFDIPKAFAEAGIPMETFKPSRATLVMRILSTPDSPQDVPLVAFLLTRPFVEGKGTWRRHVKWEAATNWNQAYPLVPWTKPGGDFATAPCATGIMPSRGAHEIYIDVTTLIAARFEDFHLTGKWFDPGMIIMRDTTFPNRCRYRMIFSFQSAPDRKPQRAPSEIRSPELYIE